MKGVLPVRLKSLPAVRVGKAAIFICCLVLMLNAAACQVSPTGPALTAPTGQTTTTTATQQPVPDWLHGANLNEHLTVSIGFWDIASALDQSDTDLVLQSIERIFNITVVPVSVSWSNYAERYKIMAATGQLPDVFATTMVNTPSYEQWVRDGVIRAIPDDLSRFPELNSIMQLSDIVNLRIDGRFYMIPRVSFIDRDVYASDAAMLVRRDWMERLDIAVPENLTEFAEMLRRFVEDDPDGNGVDDTAGMSVNVRAALGKWVLLGVQPVCNVYGWIDYDGLFQPSYMTPLFDDVVRAFRYLYQVGALDPDFATQQADDATDKFARGKLGALEYKSSPGSLVTLETRWNSHQEPGTFAEKVMVLPIFPAPDGNRYHNTGRYFWSESYFASQVDDDKMDRLMYLYEYLMTEQGRYLLSLGIEGKDYRWTDQDDIEIMRSYDQLTGRPVALKSIYPSVALFAPLARWSDDMRRGGFIPNAINNANNGEAIMQMAYDDLMWNLENTLPVDRPYDFLALLQQDANSFPTSRVIDDMTGVILSKGDPAELWEAVRQQYIADGMYDIIDKMNWIAARQQILPRSAPPAD